MIYQDELSHKCCTCKFFESWHEKCFENCFLNRFENWDEGFPRDGPTLSRFPWYPESLLASAYADESDRSNKDQADILDHSSNPSRTQDRRTMQGPVAQVLDQMDPLLVLALPCLCICNRPLSGKLHEVSSLPLALWQDESSTETRKERD